MEVEFRIRGIRAVLGMLDYLSVWMMFDEQYKLLGYIVRA